jgi:two-component system sensor histidine kinase YesM
MLRRVSKKYIFFKYVASFLLPVAITVILTLISGCYLNNFVREKNARVSENIARQLCADLHKILEETDMMMLSYTTNLNYFKRLGSVLGADTLSYEELRTLRFCQDTLDVSAKIHPYIYSVYCLPYSRRSDSTFMVSFDGVYTLADHPDSPFITSVRGGAQDRGIRVRNFQNRSLPAVRLLSKYALVKSVSHTRTEGIMIVNLDIKYIELMLNNSMHERSDDLFIVSWNRTAPIFTSAELRKLGDAKVKELLLQVKAGRPVFLPASGDPQIPGMGRKVEYLPIKEITDQYGFTVNLMASRASLYATSQNLVAANIIVILLSIVIGIVIIIIITHKRYNDIIKIGDYIEALDETGSLTAVPPKPGDGLADYVRLHLSERELKERKLEMQLLRSQLNPHFLLNTLQMLNWKIMREFKGHSDFNTIIENLCKILSYSLYPAESLAPLFEEIRYTDSYVALQRNNPKSLIRIFWEVDDSMKQYMVPRLLFQPIIENAQKHAFGLAFAEPEKASPDPRVTIRFERRYGDLHISVKDNGCGMDEKTLAKVRESFSRDPVNVSGIGLSNTHKRIQLLFGRKYGVTVNSSPGEGTEVVLRIPILLKA